MGTTKSIASLVLAALSIAVTVAALTYYRPGLNRGSLASMGGSAPVGLNKLLALDRPEAPTAVVAETPAASNEELKDWTFTHRRSYSQNSMAGSSQYMNDYQSGSLASLLRRSLSFLSMSPFGGDSGYGFSGNSYVSHRMGRFGGMHGIGAFHRSFFSRYFSAMQGFGSDGYGASSYYGFPGFQSYASQGYWGSPNYYSPAPYAYTGTPTYASSYTPPTYTPPSYSAPVYTPPTPSYVTYSTPGKSGLIWTGGPTPSYPTYRAPTTSSSYFSSFVKGATDFASSSSFVAVRVSSLELVSQTFERIVTNVGGVSTTIERTTLITKVQTEVEVRRFKHRINASPYA